MIHAPSVRSKCENRIYTITLNRPNKHNALSTDMISELQHAFEQLKHMSEAKVVLLCAEGASFCAGADLSDMHQSAQSSIEEHRRASQALSTLFTEIHTCPLPVVAKVQGPALAGGCGLVAACDFVLASHEACFGCPEVKIGFVAAIISSFLLRRVGPMHTKALLISGFRIQSSAAKDMGLVNSLHKAEALSTATLEFVQQLINHNSSHAMQLSKKLLQQLEDMNFEDALQHATKTNALARSHKDCQQGVARFLKKMPQDWSKQ